MKKLFASLGMACAFLFVVHPSSGSAHVIDETKVKSAQFDYEDYYELVAIYESPTGLTVKSYSPKWNTVNQLKEVEKELLKNKHGEEIDLLGQVVIFPDFPAGKSVLGQYFAEYEYSKKDVDLLSDRTIHLYGGNEFSTIDSIAQTLSHEYGHHFTFYHLFEDESLLPENWLDSDYAEARDLSDYPEANTGDGDYEWMMSEILAEDYVQMFGSENALKDHMQFNAQLHTAFEDEDLQTYWMERLSSDDYQRQAPIGLYLTAQNKQASVYDLQFYYPNLSNETTYVIGQDLEGQYLPVLIDRLNGESTLAKWYEASKVDYQAKSLFNSYSMPEVAFQAVQHTAEGFNRGSKKLRISYEKIEETVSSYEDIYKQEQLSMEETKELLRETAVQYDIPPEILKAMAYVHTGMKQFDENGEPIVSEDGGIGIMRVKMPEEEMKERGMDIERLKYDTRYNVETGAALLKEKWNESGKSIPKINDQSAQILEHWYFALMAYDGLTKENDPNTVEKGTTYQERVFEAIRQFSHVSLQPVPNVNVVYDEEGTMGFDVLQYDGAGLNTKTTQLHEAGDYVYGENQSDFFLLYNSVNGTTGKQLLPYTPLEVTAGPFEKENGEEQYVMYKVKGNGVEGYVASSDIQNGNITVFSDVGDDNETAAAIGYFQLRGIISGYPDGLFHPNQPLLRHHAAKMLVKELGLTLPAGYVVKAEDIHPGDLYYEEMATLEAYGLMGQGGSFHPKAPLTRSQMASILVRAYDQWYKETEKAFQFDDVPASHWNYNDINRLANNNITVVKNAFRPGQNVTRSQFTLFLKRSAVLKENE
ncbi:hypothetical protein J2S09_002391 [Bacillus fengqiuensis]|nr:hypothetical protein [Bacillus fengqiuensis]